MATKFALLALTALLINVNSVVGFSTTGGLHRATTTTTTTTTTSLHMANDDDLLRWARTSRSAAADDNVVELMRPIGVVLSEDDNGNVFVETLAPNGNAARSGKVRWNL